MKSVGLEKIILQIIKNIMGDFYRCLFFLVTPKSETKCYGILVKAGEAVPQNLGCEYLDTVSCAASFCSY